MKLRHAGLTGLACLAIIAALLLLQAFADKPPPQEFNTELYQMLMANQVTSPEEIVEHFELEQLQWLPIAPPGTNEVMQGASILPFDPKDFPKDFQNALVGEEVAGITSYQIYVYEDPLTRQRVILNANAAPLATVAAPPDYDPLWYLMETYPNILFHDCWVTPEEAELKTIWDPARIVSKFRLMPLKEVVQYVWQQSLTPPPPIMVMSVYTGADDPVNDIHFYAIERSANGITLSIVVTNSVTQLDVFACDDPRKGWWQLVGTTNLSTNWVEWLDSSAANDYYSERFYAAGNGTLDSDGDGYLDGREHFLYATDPENGDEYPITVSGEITCSESVSGTTYVVACDTSNSWSLYRGCSISATGPYSLARVASGQSYYIRTFNDENGTGTYEPGEPWGEWESNPLNSSVNVTNVDIALYTQVADTKIDPDSGIYSTTGMEVVVTTDTPGAVIRYTLDGSPPSSTNGYVSTSNALSLAVSENTVLRVMATKSGLEPTDIDTRTYLFVTDILSQAAPAGYPTTWGTDRSLVAADYTMNSDVVNSYGATATNALSAIPSLSVVMDPADLFGDEGIYDKDSSSDLEKPAHVEFIYSEGRKGTHADCAIEPHGRFRELQLEGTGLDVVNIKRSFRLRFKDEYGPSKLRERILDSAPNDAADTASQFDTLVLRAGTQMGYGGYRSIDQAWATYTRDQWGRDTQTAMSGRGVHGTYVNLYLNGLYWGLYNICERPDAGWAASYEGGDNDDWFSVNHGGIIDGSSESWTILTNLCDSGAVTNPAALDVDWTNFCDYIIAWWASGGGDWEEWPFANNFYAVGPQDCSQPLEYFCWDMELSWMEGSLMDNGAWVKPTFLDSAFENRDFHYVINVFRGLWRHAEFRMLFADRLYRHCGPGGALTAVEAQRRWMRLCDFIDDAMVLECARWGDAKAPYAEGQSQLDRNTDWYQARNYPYRLMDGNAERLLLACRNAAIHGVALYPDLDPPQLSVAGDTVTLSNANDEGTIYYCWNEDPRNSGGGLSANAEPYSVALTATNGQTLLARVRSGTNWTALAEYTHDTTPHIRITEIMYNPPGSGDSTNEWLEIANLGNDAVNIAGWRFIETTPDGAPNPGGTSPEGIEYVFPAGTTIAPGEYLVIARDPSTFSNQHANVSCLGPFDGALANEGEPIALVDADYASGTNYADRIQYLDCYDETDGEGFSLVRLAEVAPSALFRPSAFLGGSPGKEDVFVRDLSDGPPAASAGPRWTAGTNVMFTLEGQAWDDSASLTYSWSRASGPGTVTFGSPTAKATTVSFSAAGTQVVALAVSDGTSTTTATNTVVVTPTCDPAAITGNGGTQEHPRGGSGSGPEPSSYQEVPISHISATASLDKWLKKDDTYEMRLTLNPSPQTADGVPVLRYGTLKLQIAYEGSGRIDVYDAASNKLEALTTWDVSATTFLHEQVFDVVGTNVSTNADDVLLITSWTDGENTIGPATTKCTIVKVDIAMDGNRDESIDFDGTNDNHCLFWVNDDHDCLHYEEGGWHEDDSLDWEDGADTPNCDDDRIGAKGYIGGNPPSSSENHCRRDLEDFTRLHIRVDDNTVNLSGITYWMQFRHPTSGSPSVNVFEAVNEDVDYLESGSIADQQIQKTRVITVGASEVQLPSQYIKTGNQRSPFILEGKTVGNGDLTIIVKKDDDEVCKKAVTLELRPITEFYQVFQVATVGQNSTNVSDGYNPDFTGSDDYLLFVHGFNLNAADKAYWPGTIFKRLWWQGYKGHVGFFDWPCGTFSLLNLQCYDESESNAWRCGSALLDRIAQLNSSSHSGRVRVLAHSQGNVVAGEALRLASGQVVNTYIATQAAVPADCYQTGVAEYFSNYSTPNVFLTYPPTGSTYLTGVSDKAGQIFSFYNTGDYALHSAWIGSWEWNNAARPDAYYHYEGPTNSYDASAQPTPSRFYYDFLPYVPPAPRDMAFTNDTFEIFSYAGEARGSALGVQTNMDDFTTFDLSAWPLEYNTAHYSHSRQVRSNIVDEREYWSEVISDCGF